MWAERSGWDKCESGAISACVYRLGIKEARHHFQIIDFAPDSLLLFAQARRWITLGASPPYEKVAAPSEYNKKEPAKLAIVPLLRFRHCKHEIYCVLSLAKWYFLTSQKEGSRRCNFYTQWHERTTSQQLHFQREQNTLRMCKKIEGCCCASYTVPRKWKQMFSLGLPLFMSLYAKFVNKQMACNESRFQMPCLLPAQY